jgi:hypothetical protein
MCFITCNPSTQKTEEDLEFKASLGYMARPCINLKKKKRGAIRMSQVVECLPSICEALSSNLSISERDRKKESIS